MTDRSSPGTDERRAAKRLARKERKARLRRETLGGEPGVVSQVPQAARPQHQIASAAGSLGPLGKRVGRIASNMVIRQALKFLFRAVFRR